MSRLLRPLLAVLLSAGAFLFLLPGCKSTTAPPAVPALPESPPQIEWQRSVEDAEALAQAEHRPLLIAVNMDGESASDRIWRENYRDPAFIAAASRCVCVAASLFRHNVHDYDAEGRRIPCPRFGCITCGEHIAAEPKLFAKLLADGERVAPRHALVMPDGRKVFDLSLNFDLRDIDRALAAAVQNVPVRDVQMPAGVTWEQLAARRDHVGRVALEERVVRADEAQTLAALAAIGRLGDAGSLDALRLVGCPRWEDPTPLPAGVIRGNHSCWRSCLLLTPELRAALGDAVRSQGLAAATAAIWRERFEAGDRVRGLEQAAADVLDLIAELDGQNSPTRSFLLAHAMLRPHAEAALRSLCRVLPADAAAAVKAARGEAGPALEGPIYRFAPLAAPSPAPTGDEMPEAAELERTLEALDAEVKSLTEANRAVWNARFAKASLDLGRRHLETQQKDVQLLLEDAELHWKRALLLEPDRADWWIERARTAYFLGHFAEQAEHGQRAFLVATRGKPADAQVQDPVAIEALRWVGDGHARLLGERANGDPATELLGIAGGMRALLQVAHSDHTTAKDWLSLASFFGALSLRGDEVSAAYEGVKRFPADRELRQVFHSVLQSVPGAPPVWGAAKVVALLHPESADAEWWAGYAYVLAAEELRRCHDDPFDWYELAQQRFEHTMAMQADYAENCRSMVAMTWLGRGMAWVFDDRRQAAECLVEAVKVQPDLAALRDGLGYDVFDLVDKIFEWRDAGPSDVEPLALLDRLLLAAPGTPLYGIAIADSQLREALRADGRNPQRVVRDTVDAGGNRIRMPMGLATDEGDSYLQRSLAAARRVLPLLLTAEDKKVLAQSATIAAERDLERHRLAAVAGNLAEAATALGQEPPLAGADEAALVAFATKLRAELGEARPRERSGR